MWPQLEPYPLKIVDDTPARNDERNSIARVPASANGHRCEISLSLF